MQIRQWKRYALATGRGVQITNQTSIRQPEWGNSTQGYILRWPSSGTSITDMAGFDYSDWSELTLGTVPQREQAIVVPGAKDKARALLKSILAPSEWANYEKSGLLSVIGGVSGKRYVLRGDRLSMNITVNDDHGRTVEMLCCHPDGVPMEDVLVSQVLHLQYAEEAFRATANIRPYATPNLVRAALGELAGGRVGQ